MVDIQSESKDNLQLAIKKQVTFNSDCLRREVRLGETAQ